MVSHMVVMFMCLSLAVLMSNTDAQCYYFDEPCVYQNHRYGLFDMWETDDCESCFCTGDVGYECCSKFYVPTVYDRQQCTVFKDKTTCQTRLLDKHGKECEALVGVL
ncbi:beta-microseminoprotein-like [Acanthaster planci]|uniref:Beta-microseminoprotein-like n=1 Tax=Acanthaster planci TaxID=133434 RepID=A0A8B7Z1N2_ACAPL|nr:beta-microseminoprotein-like [Acanthaster planci]XP_022099513.1 beta-microseminoprotein-like [Acanthaster planci]